MYNPFWAIEYSDLIDRLRVSPCRQRRVTVTTDVFFFSFTSFPSLVPPQRESARVLLLLRARLQLCHVISVEPPLTHSKPPGTVTTTAEHSNTLCETPPGGARGCCGTHTVAEGIFWVFIWDRR
ncbi:hypothetical protein R3I93_004454 [Phoxinus phoxinus]|uniref:Uncharacterized protein n=1 Tax=Phoxinus phoxinus TaxID=58324 RepID=A0AAN9DHG0_9TELE